MGQSFHTTAKVNRARTLRKKGISSKVIAKKLGVGNTSVLRWTNDIPSKNSNHKYFEKIHQRAKARGATIVRSRKITQEHAKILTSLLYWCEGAKYPSTNFVAFANSDITLVRSFLKLLRIGFKINENKLRVHLQLHTTHNIRETTNFWSRILKIPPKQFYKPTITSPTNRMKRREYMGTCTIRYYDVYLLLEIIGVFEKFSEKFD